MKVHERHSQRGGRRRRALLEQPLLVGVALVAGLGSVSCSTQETRENIRARGQRSTQVSLQAFQEALEAGAVVGASGALYVGDRVQVKSAGIGWAALSNTGTTATQVGTDSRVGPIWSDSHLDLRDRVTVYGEAKAPSFSLGNQVVVQGGTSTTGRGLKDELLTPFQDLPERQLTPIVVESGQEKGLEPGKYGSLTVRGQAKAWFDPAAYSFSSLIVEQGGQVITKSECTPVMLQVRNQLHFRGTVVEDGGDDAGVGLILRYDGTQTGHIEQAFRGNVIAPAAELILSSHSHHGAFFAKTLRIQSDATVTEVEAFVPAAGQCGFGVDIGAPPVPTDIGPAPELSDPQDLDAFLDWYYKITAAERAEAEARISAVAPSSGIRQEVIARFGSARNDQNVGHALMLLAFLGALPDPAVTPFLIDLVEEPITETEQPNSDATTPFDLEVSYRRQSLYILAQKGSTEAETAVKDVAVSHSVGQLRKAAIRALIHDQPNQVVEDLRAEIQPQDEFYLDLPSRSDPEFFEKLEALRQKYATN